MSMLQYLINATAIWLLSLLMFDLLLRKESFHNYNRFYLLFTLIAGLTLPLLQWEDSAVAKSVYMQQPVERIGNIKNAVISVATPATYDTDINWTRWLWLVYLGGIIVGVLFLVRELHALRRLYVKGLKHKEQEFTIVETGRAQTPFSISRIVFVSSKKNYSANEWEIILHHEKRHNTLYHFIDLLVIQCAQILFWFNPLIYLYKKRLLLVHEYQADTVAHSYTGEYGQFLIEQSLLSSAPALSNSLNRSPIKKRIVMLTKRSSAFAKSKLLVFIPLLLFCTLCFTQTSYSRKTKDTYTVTFRGNKIEMKAPVTKKVKMQDANGKEIEKEITWDGYPTTMNGKKIYNNGEVTTEPVFFLKDKPVFTYFLEQLNDELSGLPDGKYRFDLFNLVIDEQGKLVYYVYGDGVHIRNSKEIGVDASLKDKIDRRAKEVLDNMPNWQPAVLNGKHVIFNVTSTGFAFFDVKDHQVLIQ